MLMRMLAIIIFIQLLIHASTFSRPTHVYMSNAESNSALKAKPRRPCVVGEKWSKSPDQYGNKFTRLQTKDFVRLERRVRRLENILHELCSAIVYSDDMALTERQMLQSGAIYQDPNNETSRLPILLRRETADIAWRHGNPVSPPAHKWH